MYYLVNCSN